MIFRWGAVALVCVCATGCSSFNRDWKARLAETVASERAAEETVEGLWEGSWVSDKNGHHGRLRAIITADGPGRYQARYRAAYLRVLRFEIEVPLTAETRDGRLRCDGQADIGKLAGGVYVYRGTIKGDKFDSTYEARYDHGRYLLTRVPPPSPFSKTDE